MRKLRRGSVSTNGRTTTIRSSACGPCRGCRFQDLPYEDQLGSKEAQVRETLSHLGDMELPSVIVNLARIGLHGGGGDLVGFAPSQASPAAKVSACCSAIPTSK